MDVLAMVILAEVSDPARFRERAPTSEVFPI